MSHHSLLPLRKKSKFGYQSPVILLSIPKRRADPVPRLSLSLFLVFSVIIFVNSESNLSFLQVTTGPCLLIFLEAVPQEVDIRHQDGMRSEAAGHRSDDQYCIPHWY